MLKQDDESTALLPKGHKHYLGIFVYGDVKKMHCHSLHHYYTTVTTARVFVNFLWWRNHIGCVCSHHVIKCMVACKDSLSFHLYQTGNLNMYMFIITIVYPSIIFMVTLIAAFPQRYNKNSCLFFWWDKMY